MAKWISAAIVAAIIVTLREIGLRYFQGNVLGFLGLCVLLVLGAYGFAAGCTYCYNRWAKPLRRDETTHR